jgi:molecular chaperone GrpE
MKRHDEKGTLKDTLEDPESEAAGEAEPKGLVGVDAEPLPPPSREEIEALRRERDELKDQLLRRRADFDNYRKRVERDRHQAGLDATADLFKALVPTLDNLERALEAEGSASTLRQGVELTLRDLLGLLESRGVVVHDPTGQPFDPNIHQALSHEVVPGTADGTVVETFRKGYFFKDRLLRPALVKVAKAGGHKKDGEEPPAVH